MASSRKWARTISLIASRIYFLLIIFQIPLFRIPCRSGICRTPIQVTCSQLIASELVPRIVVKALLYPGAIANALFKSKTIPSYNNLLELYNLTNMKAALATSDLHRIELLAGSYLSVAGAILGLIKPRRLSLFGTLLILWGLVREAMRKSADRYLMEAIYIYPTMLIAVVFAFLSIRKDVRKIVRSYKDKRHANYSCSHLKAKQGIQVVLPDKATMEHTVIPAIEALSRKDMEGASNLLRISLQVLLVRAVNSVIIASDDIASEQSTS